jgi:hypothetical protein
MERRNFFKSIFGAAVVIAMPKIVVEQIEKNPPPFPLEKSVIYIYNEEELIGESLHFKVNINQDYITIPPVKEVKFWTGEYTKKGKKKYRYQFVEDFSGYPEYIKGLKAWDVDVTNLKWKKDPEQVFQERKLLHCLMKIDTVIITGDIHLSSLNLSAKYEGVTHDAKFVGSGALRLKQEKNEI